MQRIDSISPESEYWTGALHWHESADDPGSIPIPEMNASSNSSHANQEYSVEPAKKIHSAEWMLNRISCGIEFSWVSTCIRMYLYVLGVNKFVILQNTFPTKITFSPDTLLFFPISADTALTKTLTYPSTLWGHTLNAAARFMTYPKL